MSSIRKTILLQVLPHRRLCTFSFLRKTYSLLQMRRSLVLASRPRCLHSLHDASHCMAKSSVYSPRKSCGKVFQSDGPCLTHGSLPSNISSGCTTQSSRHFSSRTNCLNESRKEGTEDGSISEANQPKREGELLNHTNLLRSPKQRFVLTSSLAQTIRERIWPGDSLKEETATIITANEGAVLFWESYFMDSHTLYLQYQIHIFCPLMIVTKITPGDVYFYTTLNISICGMTWGWHVTTEMI